MNYNFSLWSWVCVAFSFAEGNLSISSAAENVPKQGPTMVMAYTGESPREWIEDPVSVPVEVVATEFYAGTTATVTLSALNLSVAANDCDSTAVDKDGIANLQAYRPYTLTMTGTQLSSGKIELQPKASLDLVSARGRKANVTTFKLYIDGTESYMVTDSQIGCGSFTKTWTVEVRPDGGPRPVKKGGDSSWSRAEDNLPEDAAPGDADPLEVGPGESSDPSIVQVKWGVNVGRLNNGRAAGKIRLRQAGLTTQSFSPAALTYTKTSSDQNELDVYPSTGVLQQVKGPQGLAHIVTLSSWSYEIKFYKEFSGSGGGTPYVPIGTPFVTYKIESPTQTTANLKITETRGDLIYLSYLDYISASTTWQLTTKAQPEVTAETRTVTRQITFPSGKRKEVVTIKNPFDGTERYKAEEEYTNLNGNWELTKITVDPSGPDPQVTEYSFYPTTDPETQAGKLQWIKYPDGFWEKRIYYDDSYFPPDAPPGFLWMVLRPWKDAPSAPETATELDSWVTEYTYGQHGSAGAFFADQVIARHNFDGIIDARARTRYESFTESYCPTCDPGIDSGNSVREELRFLGEGAYGDPTRSGTLIPSAGAYRAEFPDYQIFNDDSQVSYLYDQGTYTPGNPPSSAQFTASASGDALKTTAIYGANGQNYQGQPGFINLFEGRYVRAIYLSLENQSRKEVTITKKGLVLLRETYVLKYNSVSQTWSSGPDEKIDQLEYAYDGSGHLTSVTRRDPKSGSVRVIYSADWTYNSKLDNLKRSETDEFGTKTFYTYDSLKRVKTIRKEGAPAHGQQDITTTFSYDAAGNVLSETTSGGGLNLATSRTFDKAGRILTETSPESLTKGSCKNNFRHFGVMRTF